MLMNILKQLKMQDMEAELLVLTAEHDKLSREVDVSIKSLLKEKEARQKLQNDVESANKKMLQMLASDGAGKNNATGACVIHFYKNFCSLEIAPQADLLSEIETRLTATSQVAAKNHKELAKAQRVHCKMTEVWQAVNLDFSLETYSIGAIFRSFIKPRRQPRCPNNIF